MCRPRCCPPTRSCWRSTPLAWSRYTTWRALLGGMDGLVDIWFMCYSTNEGFISGGCSVTAPLHVRSKCTRCSRRGPHTSFGHIQPPQCAASSLCKRINLCREVLGVGRKALVAAAGPTGAQGHLREPARLRRQHQPRRGAGCCQQRRQHAAH